MNQEFSKNMEKGQDQATLYREWFEYTHLSNQKLADLLLGYVGKPWGESGRLISHILNAHQVWNSRILMDTQPVDPWAEYAPEEWKQIEEINFAKSIEILDKYDLNQWVAYTNSKGQSFKNTIGDILFHVINHSTYHRGQIALVLRWNGLAAISTDYIFYKR